jgi:uncharacterized membrane-anchored protein YjiN (DUF445 family)
MKKKVRLSEAKFHKLIKNIVTESINEAKANNTAKNIINKWRQSDNAERGRMLDTLIGKLPDGMAEKMLDLIDSNPALQQKVPSALTDRLEDAVEESIIRRRRR